MNVRTLALAVLVVVALPALAATVVNINTADSATLQTLSGIGPSKAQAIIDYRTQHGPFAAISDIMNVSGIGTATYNNIKDFITVGDTGTTQTQTQTTQTTQVQADTTAASTTQVVQSTASVSPPQITAQITTDTIAVVGAGTVFSGQSFGSKGEPLSGVRYIWNFGDGTTGEGAYIEHTYRYPGTYDVALSVAYNYSSATARLLLPAVAARVGLAAEGDGSLTIQNQADIDLDVGLWSLRQGTSTFVLPEGTVLLRDKGIRFAPDVMGFSGGTAAQLYFPNGSAASSARVSAASPLRGEVVELPSATITSKKSSGLLSGAQPAPAGQTSSQQSSPTVKGGEQAAAAATANMGGLWPYLLGLTGVIALGVVGVYYAHVPRPRLETELTAEEFDIE